MFHGGSSFESSKGPRPLLPRAFRVACLIADVALKHPKAHLFFSGRRFLLHLHRILCPWLRYTFRETRPPPMKRNHQSSSCLGLSQDPAAYSQTRSLVSFSLNVYTDVSVSSCSQITNFVVLFFAFVIVPMQTSATIESPYWAAGVSWPFFLTPTCPSTPLQSYFPILLLQKFCALAVPAYAASIVIYSWLMSTSNHPLCLSDLRHDDILQLLRLQPRRCFTVFLRRRANWKIPSYANPMTFPSRICTPK